MVSLFLATAALIVVLLAHVGILPALFEKNEAKFEIGIVAVLTDFIAMGALFMFRRTAGRLEEVSDDLQPILELAVSVEQANKIADSDKRDKMIQVILARKLELPVRRTQRRRTKKPPIQIKQA